MISRPTTNEHAARGHPEHGATVVGAAVWAANRCRAVQVAVTGLEESTRRTSAVGAGEVAGKDEVAGELEHRREVPCRRHAEHRAPP
jgi:hypothetical protein